MGYQTTSFERKVAISLILNEWRLSAIILAKPDCRHCPTKLPQMIRENLGDVRIPSGILTANMTVLRCHFATSHGYDRSVRLPRLGRIAATVQWLNTTMPKENYSSSSMSMGAGVADCFLTDMGLGRRTLIDAASRVLLMCAA
jgi:putative component of membrane protein insertase Oxa1/YidC/SpoIIIJ protein YidD